jgi:hypothetical protein
MLQLIALIEVTSIATSRCTVPMLRRKYSYECARARWRVWGTPSRKRIDAAPVEAAIVKSDSPGW